MTYHHMNSITGRSICRVKGVSHQWPIFHHLCRWNVCNPGQRYPPMQMLPNLPRSHIAPWSLLRRQSWEQNICKGDLVQSIHITWIMQDYTVLSLCSPTTKTRHTLIRILPQMLTVNLFLYLLEESVQLSHSYNGVVLLSHQCKPRILQIYPIHPNSMPLPFLSDTNDLPLKLWSNGGSGSILAHRILWLPHWGRFPHCASPESTCCCWMLLADASTSLSVGTLMPLLPHLYFICNLLTNQGVVWC